MTDFKADEYDREDRSESLTRNARLSPPFWDREYWHLRAIREFVVRALESGARGRALDYGAGDSPYRSLFERAGLELIAADITSDNSSVLKIDDEGRLPARDGYFDLVLSTQVLEHVPDVNRYLKEAHRVLRPGGMLLISTHGSFILHRHPVDLRRWTVDGLRFELEQAGFKVHRVEPHVGILANSTHQRAFVYGGLLKRSAWTRWLRPILFGLFNLRMAIEDWLTPPEVMEVLPSLLLVKAFKEDQ